MRKIYITGCAKSGTTLLRRMFYSFRRCSIVDEEIDIDAFLQVASRDDFKDDDAVVGKRTVSTVFSNIMFPKYREHQLKTIKDNDIKVVNIIRDGRDAILNGWISCDRWIASLQDAETYKDYITATVYFEDLIRQPDKVQGDLVLKLGLEPHAAFSDYPKFMEADDSVVGHYKKYKLSEGKIGQDLERYKKVCPGLREQFDEQLKRHGYL